MSILAHPCLGQGPVKVQRQTFEKVSSASRSFSVAHTITQEVGGGTREHSHVPSTMAVGFLGLVSGGLSASLAPPGTVASLPEGWHYQEVARVLGPAGQIRRGLPLHPLLWTD